MFFRQRSAVIRLCLTRPVWRMAQQGLRLKLETGEESVAIIQMRKDEV